MKTILQVLALCAFCVLSPKLYAQDCGCTQCNLPIVADYSRNFELNVSGATFNNLATAQQGVCSVDIDFAHDFLSDLKITLVSPAGQMISLVASNAPNDTTYFSRWKIHFVPCGASAAPDPGFADNFDDNLNWPQHSTFAGSYYPASGCLEDFNAGPVNGQWLLTVSSSNLRGVGFIYGFKINFCQSQGIACDGLNYPFLDGDDCSTALPLPGNISTYIGNTSLFTPDFHPFFCGTIENDQWFYFVSNCDTIGFTITPGYCINGDGVQIALYPDCNSSPIACNGGHQHCGFCPLSIVASTIPGHVYFLMIDGFSGDQCDFEFTVPPGCVTSVGIPNPPYQQPHGCADAQRKVSLSKPVFGAAGYIWSATNGALVNGQTETVVVGPDNLSVTLTLGSEDGEVCVRAYNFTDTSKMVCLPFTVDTNIYLVENAVVCYDQLPYVSQYFDNGVAPVFTAGTHDYLLTGYLGSDGQPYGCDVHLKLNLTIEGSYSQLPTALTLGAQYVLPTGEVVETSGPHNWSEPLPSGCNNDYFQNIILLNMQQHTDGCYPDSVTFLLPAGYNLLLECQGGTPPFVAGPGLQTVIYQNSGDFDIIAHVGASIWTFTDTVMINYAPPVQAGFTFVTDSSVVHFNNQSQNAASFLWNFGDGTTSTETNPLHQYSGSGDFSVTLTAMGTCGSVVSTHAVHIESVNPQAAFLASNTVGCQPLQVQFTDQSTGNPGSWNWQFPGGAPSSSTLQNPTVIYLNPGVFDVSLTVENSAGQSTFIQTGLVQVEALPTSAYGYQTALDTVFFHNQSQNAVTYLWDFGDPDSGILNTSSEENPVHIFTTPGTYFIVFQATNACGTSIFQQYITLEGVAPSANFEALTVAGCAPLSVQFNDLSTGNPTTWHWTFPGGNPASSAAQNPLVTYDVPGVYTVTLIAENASGASTAEHANAVNVLDIPTANFDWNTNNGLATFAASDPGAETYAWNFGDPASGNDNSASGPSPEHLFSSPGTYFVTLITGNACGFDTTTESIVILLSETASPGEQGWLHLQPNPSDGHFELELRDKPSVSLQWRLFNAFGQCLAQRHLGQFNGHTVEKLDFSQFPAAVYWLEVFTAEKRSWMKLVIQ